MRTGTVQIEKTGQVIGSDFELYHLRKNGLVQGPALERDSSAMVSVYPSTRGNPRS